MKRLLNTLAITVASLLITLPAYSLGVWSGYVAQGGVKVVENMNGRRTTVQGSYPFANVKVCVISTNCTVTATLFSDSAGTIPLSNPFPADRYGHYVFYTTSTVVDLQFSGGTPAIPSPWTEQGIIPILVIGSLVPTSRQILTTSPISGGGDLTVDRTLSCPTCVVTSRTISTTSPLGGGGDLSANRTFTCSTCAVTNAVNNWTSTQTPNATATYDFGSLAKFWKDGYFSGSLVVGAGSIPTPSIHLASSTAGIYFPAGATPALVDSSGNSASFTLPAGTINVFLPTTGDQHLPNFPQLITLSGPTAPRTWTVPDQDITIAAKEIDNGFTAKQTITNSAAAGSAVSGTNSNAADTDPAIVGTSQGVNGYGMLAWGNAAGAIGIKAQTSGANGYGVWGNCNAGAAGCVGMYASTQGTGSLSYGLLVQSNAAASVFAQASLNTNAQPTIIAKDNGGGQPANTSMLEIQNAAGAAVAKIDKEGDATINSAVITTKINSYNGTATAANGVAPIYGSVSLVTQNTSLGPTNIIAAAPAGLYRVCWSQRITTAAGVSSSLLTTIGWNNGGAKTATIASLNGGVYQATADVSNTLNSEMGNCISITSAAAQNITYTTTYASNAANAMQYALRITVEQLQTP